jgi:UrcA family protein
MFASAASASNPITITWGDPPQARVNTRDVDLRSLTGRSTVEHRIRRASEELCVDGQADPTVLQPVQHFTDCYNVAVASGMSQLNQLAGQ